MEGALAASRYAFAMTWKWLVGGGCLTVLIASSVLIGHPFQRWGPSKTASSRVTSCRLPAYVRETSVGGFLTVPGYTFSQDPKFSPGSLSYDAALGKWLPVEPALISHDGNWYAYQTPNEQSSSMTSTIHLVDRHLDRTVWTGKGFARLLGWTDDGAVFVHSSTDPRSVAEYWLAQIPSGTLRPLAAMAGDTVRTDSAGVWATRVLPTGPESGSGAPLHATLIRTDLTTGASVTWWEGAIPGLILLLGFDGAQHPILSILPDAEGHERLVLLSAPHIEIEIAMDTSALHFFPAASVGDQQGVWFGDIDGLVWLWNPTDGLRRVAQLPAQPSDKPNIASIAGPCR